KRYKQISFSESIRRRLKVMDQTALSLCMENNMPIIVFDIFQKGNLQRIINGETVGTLISNSEEVVLDSE
ncbi:MAG TPA: UMP kinase, partial [Leptospiraceae bacterium]|nr:UMP kinase [Leptospiraceae bacterium]